MLDSLNCLTVYDNVGEVSSTVKIGRLFEDFS